MGEFLLGSYWKYAWLSISFFLCFSDGMMLWCCSYHLDLCKNVFGPGIYPDVAATNLYYGGTKIAGSNTKISSNFRYNDRLQTIPKNVIEISLSFLKYYFENASSLLLECRILVQNLLFYFTRCWHFEPQVYENVPFKRLQNVYDSHDNVFAASSFFCLNYRLPITMLCASFIGYH